MKLKITRVEVWAAGIEDRPGGVAEKLELLASAGTNLGFILARRAPESPGLGVVFVTPLKGSTQFKAASDAGFLKTEILRAVRVEGSNRAGTAVKLARQMPVAGTSLL